MRTTTKVTGDLIVQQDSDENNDFIFRVESGECIARQRTGIIYDAYHTLSCVCLGLDIRYIYIYIGNGAERDVAVLHSGLVVYFRLFY